MWKPHVVTLAYLLVAYFMIEVATQTPSADEKSIFVFGKPSIFVTPEDQHFDPYRLINKYKRTFMLEEFMSFAENEQDISMRLILYDLDDTDVVRQNLGKEQYWAFINSTGSLPGLSVINTTFKVNVPFHTRPDDHVAFYVMYKKSFVSKETHPPYDIILEIPAESRTFRVTKTAVDFQAWGLLRWQLSDKPFVTWKKMKEVAESLRPYFNKSDPTNRKGNWDVEPTSFRKVPNPCLADFFLIYLVLGDKESKIHHVYADIPAFHLKEDFPNFFNLTGSFCPYYETESHEECGFVDQIVLTNDHLVALTDKGIYVSSSLNVSNSAVASTYEEKPLISYDLIDPCAKFAEYISCFKQGLTSLASELIHSVRLFYTPICNLYQNPFYEDRLIFVMEHTTAGTDETDKLSRGPPVRAVTVLYASKPYKEWYALFIGKDKYSDATILELVGIFFNHQLRHFDITLKVQNEDGKSTNYRRFVLLDRIVEGQDSMAGYSELNGFQGNGFLEKKFPGTFELLEVVVNPGPMDVYFIGNQLWVAESAGPLVYTSLAGLSDLQSIKECSFNHPDRIFVCVNADNTRLLIGRIGSQYGIQVVEVDSLVELWTAAGPRGAYWTQEFAEGVMKSAMYTAAFSGRILLWYLYDPEVLRKSQVKLIADVNEDATACASYCSMCADQVELVKACSQLVTNKDEIKKQLPTDKRGPYFRMIAIEPIWLTPLQEPTAGPLVPLFVDAVTVLLYEARLPGNDAEYVYFSGVYIGQQIVCANKTDDALAPDAFRNPSYTDGCRIYIRHIKPVDRFLSGFRQVLYGTLQKPPPLIPFPAKLRVLQIAASNLVFVRVMDAGLSFTDDHVGQTLHIPGNFSMLLQGFPDDTEKASIMWGYSTVHVRSQNLAELKKYHPFLIDMSTAQYREKRIAGGADKDDWDKYEKELEDEQKEQQAKQDAISASKIDVQAKYSALKYATAGKQLFKTTAPVIIEKFNPLEILKNAGPIGRKKRDVAQSRHIFQDIKRFKISERKLPLPRRSTHNMVRRAATAIGQNPASEPNPPWTVSDGECHFDLTLMPNPVVFNHGGRISLDLHDAVSFTVKLRPKTELGTLMLYRPLFVITNSNPDVLQVEKKVTRNVGAGLHTAKITMYPTGAKMGVASLVIRSIITSLKCETSPSMTFIVQIHRAEGRRLHINYPIPTCQLPGLKGGYPFRWRKDDPNCIPYEEILHAPDKTQNPDVQDVLIKGSLTVFTELPINYRPPSIRGEKIPLSENIYNADPDPNAKKYNDWYHISKDSSKYRKCNFRVNRTECKCTIADRLSDDERFSDCKEMVYTVVRGKAISINIEYEPIMRPEDQHPEFFSPKKHLSVYIEEINKRAEFSIISGEETDLLRTINSDAKLNTTVTGEQRKFYNAKNIIITLHGTGLYHFRAGLGRFDSFEEVTGYFILYSGTNELNHIKLIVVLLLTITFCFSLIFFGFLRVRRRLSSQLPFQSRQKSKAKED